MGNLVPHILFADDDDDYHLLFEQALKETGILATLSTAFNGLEAITILDKEKIVPQVIFLDINMPKMNGLAALKLIRSQDAFRIVPIVMFSTILDPSIISEAYRLGANLFLSKPNKFADYLKIIVSFLDNK